MAKMSKETAYFLRKQRKKFIRKFGREPGPDDPVVFDENCDVPQHPPESKMAEVDQAILTAMIQADVPPQFIYAFKKTGLLGIRKDKSLWDPEDIKAWDAALDEYFALEDAAKTKSS